MRKLLLTMSVAAAVTAGAAPMTAYAKDMTALSINCGSSLIQGSPYGSYIAITNQEEETEKLKELLANCGINPDDLLENICPGVPDNDVSVPDTDISAPDTDVSIPDASVPEAPVPGETQPTPPASELPVPDTSAPEVSAPDEELPGASEDVHPYVLRIVELVNEERAKAGLNPVTLDAAASSAAQIRAKEIVSSFSHTRPNGSSFSTALKEQGVSYRSAGENIAYGQRTPEQVMEGWMNSSGHRANILNKSFTHIGVGYHQENGVNYWTQLFFQ